MAKSVLELAVGTGQWDAGLKKAKSALDNFTQANGGLRQALEKESQKMQKFVQMMGGMESTAKTAKGQMNDYKSTIEQLTMQYNRMTEAQKKVIGQDYLQAIEQMKQKYQSVNEEIQEMNRSLKNVEIPEMKGSGLFSGMGDKMSGALAVFGGNMMTAAAGAVANLGAEMADMVKQGIEMAKAGEGVRIAFERLGNGQILDGLREATHGTVTDLELMKAAVKFNDFKLPVEELGTMLAFAQQKAKDTGQSVDYMVDSIVTGLGRKSLMILDNLGLSAAEIKDKMKDTGDMTKAVGAIIREQMAKAGDYVETAADRAAQANVNMQNKMEELGRKFAPLQEASNSLWTSMKIGILDVIGGPLTDLLNKLTEAGRLRNALNNINGDGTRGNTQVSNKLKQLQAAKNSGASQYILNTMQSGVIEGYNRQINEREQAIKDWKSWRSGNRSEGLQQRIGQWRDKYGTDVNSIKAEADAYRTMIAEYRKGAKDIMTPVTVDVKTDNPVKPTNPTKTTKEDIQYADDSIMAQEKLISDLTQKWKTASAAVKDDYKKQLDAAQSTLDTMMGKTAKAAAQPQMVTGLSGFNEQTISAWTSMIKSDLAKADIGSDLYNSLTKNLRDMSFLTTTVQDAIKLGLEIPQDVVEQMYEQVFDQNNLPTDMYVGMIQKFIDDFKEQTGKDLLVGTDGSLSEQKSDKKQEKEEDEFKKFNEGVGKLTGGLSSVTSGLKAVGVEIPKEVDQVIGVVNGVSQIISGVGTIISIFGSTAITANTTAVGLNTAAIGGLIAALEFNTASNFIPFFANGGIVPHAANGYFVGGNSFSGDNTPIMANAGELVLNKAQQGVLASALEDGSGLNNIQLQAIISGEDIILTTNNRTNRVGYQELLVKG